MYIGPRRPVRKAVRQMKRIGQMLLVMMFAALLVMAVPTLVQGPESGTAAMPDETLPTPVLMRAEAVAADNVIPLPEKQQEKHDAAPCTETDDACMVCAVVVDGNGWPVTGRTWTKTVYAVCPPEGMPG